MSDPDPKDLRARIFSAITDMFEGGSTAANMRIQVGKLQGILEGAGRQAGQRDAFDDLKKRAGDLVATLGNPAAIAAYVDQISQSHGDAYPDICDAIEDQDVTALKAALETWPVNARFGAFGSTALYHAMAELGSSIAVMEALLDAGADPSMGLDDSTALHGLGFGVHEGVDPVDLARVIRRCVALGADIEARTPSLGWTPLIYAASERNAVAMEAWLLAGADVHARAGPSLGGQGMTVAAFARFHPECAALVHRFSRAD